ncbi:hypothetical protein POM88_021481 [Heracleum sosnowskyi]|uniref:Glyoxalase At5g48480-like N-terminal domain-containing protein n=1 Tax=Heracleum sosnowskyi TaxID=360622 RepID=A0AAD8MSJ0_9APIA|nr:hypothetical protein POM88_021481 [Heracleum sosnowskyi]
MAKEPSDEIKESKKATCKGMTTQIFVEEPYGPEAIEFYKIVFRATELSRVTKTIKTSDKIKGTARFESCELKIGPSCIIVSECNPDSYLVNKSSAGTRIGLVLKEIDGIIADAVELGAVSEEGDITTTGRRRAVIKDPYGIIWIIRSPALLP